MLVNEGETRRRASSAIRPQITGVKSRYGIEAQNYLGRDGRSRVGTRTSRSATSFKLHTLR